MMRALKLEEALRNLLATIDLHTDCMDGMIDREALDDWIEEAEELLGPLADDTTGICSFDLVSHLHRQREFSEKTFGPGSRPTELIKHISKELHEIASNPEDLMEWVDVILLALDGCWRAGHSPEEIALGIVKKQTINESRDWPDWRTVTPGQVIEHIRKESVRIEYAWISVDEELPDDDITVMVTTKGCDQPVWLAFHDADSWYSVEGVIIQVTHWTHLPEPVPAKLYNKPVHMECS